MQAERSRKLPLVPLHERVFIRELDDCRFVLRARDGSDWVHRIPELDLFVELTSLGPIVVEIHRAQAMPGREAPRGLRAEAVHVVEAQVAFGIE
jgi:hypothetical protein